MNLEAILNLSLTAINAALPFIKGQSPAIGAAVEVIAAAAPIVAKTAADLKPMVMNIIAALKADPATALAELDKLEAAEAILDASFDDAAAKAIAEDDAAGGVPGR